jgi:hypothetical protein
MATQRVPAPLREGSSGEKEVFQLVNLMRAHLLALETSFQVLADPPSDAPNGEAAMSFRYSTNTGLLYVWDPVALAWQTV